MIAALGRDLDAALARGAARDPWPGREPGAALLLFALLCTGAGVGLYQLGGHQTGFALANGAAALLPPALWQWLTVLGDERVPLALSLLFARRHPRVFWTLICAALVAIAYSRGLKPLVDAARPPAVLAPGAFELIGPALRNHSFPSGHSVTAGVCFGTLALFARQPRVRWVLLGVALVAGLSRVAVGVHWPVDVAAGLAGGVLAVFVGVWLARRSPWGYQDGGVHLAFVTLAAFAAVGLWYDDGGYDAAALPLRVLAVVSLGSAALGYLLLPVVRIAFGWLRPLAPGGAA